MTFPLKTKTCSFSGKTMILEADGWVVDDELATHLNSEHGEEESESKDTKSESVERI